MIVMELRKRDGLDGKKRQHIGETMLDDIDRAYFAERLRHAEEKAAAARDERSARPFNDLIAEYRQKLSELAH